MLKVVVDKKRWLRGHNPNGDTALYRPDDGKMCCIGFLARKLGCKVSDIRAKAWLNGVETNKAQEFSESNATQLEEAYEVNDDEELTDSGRIKKLRSIGNEMGVRFVFTNGRSKR